MKKILIIHTGGTFGMIPMEPSKTLKPGNLQASIEQHLPQVSEIASLEVRVAFNLDSSNIGPQQWKIIYQIIRQEMDNYDGFVVIHGTDTIVYTAAVLSYLLHDLKKSVILTGSQRPLSAIRSDARGNLINAVELATYQIPEVAICFGNHLLRGNRTKKMSIENYSSFESPNYAPLANIGLNIHLNRKYFLKRGERVALQPEFNPGVAAIHIFPGLNPEHFRPMLSPGISVLYLIAFGAGNLPALDSNWLRYIDEAVTAGKTVVIGSQSPHGTIDLDLYACGKSALEAGAIGAGDMTIEAALIKLMVLSGNFSDKNETEQWFTRSLAGELTEKDGD
jgi:L-asparaginase